MNIGDYVEANENIREPLGEHLINQGTRGHIVNVSTYVTAYTYEVRWERSRKSCWVGSFDVRVIESAPVEDDSSSSSEE